MKGVSCREPRGGVQYQLCLKHFVPAEAEDLRDEPVQVLKCEGGCLKPPKGCIPMENLLVDLRVGDELLPREKEPR